MSNTAMEWRKISVKTTVISCRSRLTVMIAYAAKGEERSGNVGGRVRLLDINIELS